MARTYLVRTIRPGFTRPGFTRPGFTRRGFAHCGFTLIEVVVALFIVSLAVAVAVPAYRSLGEVDDLTRATRRVETLFRLARDSAIRSGLPVTVVIDSIDGLVWIDTVEPLGLSSPEVRDALAYPDYAPEPGMLSALVGDQNDDELLEPGSPIGLPGTVHMELPRARARFTFEPTGAALADTLLLSGPLATRVVTVDPWTGDVTVR
jgi:prepilin-type N-terminal cleavage/methylation domain-containing protein